MSTNLNVCILIPCITLGGTEIQTINLIRALRIKDHAVTALCYFEYEDNVVRNFESAGAQVVLLKWNRGINALNFINDLYTEIHNLRPDVVHIQYMTPGALPIIAARLAGVKKVFATVHQPHILSHGRIAKLILNSASLLCTKFIAVSQNAEKSWFGTSRLFDENKTINLQPRHFTIHNAVDTDGIKKIVEATDTEKLKAEIKIPTVVRLIGTVSRLRHEKGIDLLIEAFDLLIKEGFNIHLLIVGSGPDEDKLKKQVEDLGISGSITFYGAADWEAAIGIMSVMEIVVVPSRFEGFGLTAAEAMAAGKPVIASDNFGLKEVVTDNETGLTFKTEDIYDLKEKLKILLNDPLLCRKYGAAGQERAEKLFDISVFNSRIARLYER
jgi:glycosyltransferase involved in cell wall biosynthesis